MSDTKLLTAEEIEAIRARKLRYYRIPLSAESGAGIILQPGECTALLDHADAQADEIKRLRGALEDARDAFHRIMNEDSDTYMYPIADAGRTAARAALAGPLESGE
jgi:hypothetical protein